jgi:hypothetical protein
MEAAVETVEGEGVVVEGVRVGGNASSIIAWCWRMCSWSLSLSLEGMGGAGAAFGGKSVCVSVLGDCIEALTVGVERVGMKCWDGIENSACVSPARSAGHAPRSHRLYSL